jgi:hypothetical protein
VELEDLHIIHTIFLLRAPEVDLLNEFQRVFNCTELLGVHFDGVVRVLHDQQILLDYDLVNPCKFVELRDLQAVLTANFGIQRIQSPPRLLINDYDSIPDLHIDVAIEVIELSV